MNNQKVKVLLISFAGLLLTTPTVSLGGADSGIFLGIGAGDATIKDSDFDESDSAYKVFAGYNFGVVPLVDLAIEASYVHFGNPSVGVASAEVTGLNAYGLAGLSFGPLGLFAKAGVINWGADTSDGTVTNSESGTDPAYGVGARLAFGSFSVRAEYEYYDLSSETDIDVGMASISGIWTF
jgi:hypothetical protein